MKIDVPLDGMFVASKMTEVSLIYMEGRQRALEVPKLGGYILVLRDRLGTNFS